MFSFDITPGPLQPGLQERHDQGLAKAAHRQAHPLLARHQRGRVLDRLAADAGLGGPGPAQRRAVRAECDHCDEGGALPAPHRSAGPRQDVDQDHGG